MGEVPEVVDGDGAPVETPEPGPSTEVVHVTAAEPPEAMLWKHFATVAKTICNTNFVPEKYQGKVPETMACLAYGREIGLSEMTSMQAISVIKGNPTLSAEAMRALIRAAGHSLTTVEYTDEVVTLHGKRVDNGDEATVSYSMADARTAELTGNATYRKHPRRMLLARCSSEIRTLLFSDVGMGFYTPEEMDDVPEPGPRRVTAQERIAQGDEWTDEAEIDDLHAGGPIPMDERRRPPIEIVQSDPQHAGTVRRVDPFDGLPATAPAADPFTGWNWHMVDEKAVCNACGHEVGGHSEIRRGCIICACTIVEWSHAEDAHIVGESDSSDPSEPAPAATPQAVNDTGKPVEGPDPTPPDIAGPPAGDTGPPPLAPIVGGGPVPNPLTESQRRKIHAVGNELHLDDDARHIVVAFITASRTTSSSDLTTDEAEIMLNLYGQIRTGALSVGVHDGELKLLVLNDRGTRFLKGIERAVLPARGRSGIQRDADGAVEDVASEVV